MKNNNQEELYRYSYAKILNFLSSKPRSEREVSERLKFYIKKSPNYDLPEAGKVAVDIMEALKRDKLIDDASYANAYVQERMRSGKGASRTKITIFLSGKGVPREIQQNALDQFNVDIERDKALLDANKKMRNLQAAPVSVQRNKLYAYLKSKGYPYHIISTVVDTVLDVK